MRLESVPLSQAQWRRFHEAMVELHRPTDIEALRLTCLRVLRLLFSCETVSLCDLRGRMESWRCVPWVEMSPDVSRKLRTIAPEKTMEGAYVQTAWERDTLGEREALLTLNGTIPNTPPDSLNHGRVLRISDHASLREFRSTEVYAECYAPVDREIWIGLDVGFARLNLAVSRRGLDFSEAEMLMLELLRPHLAVAFQHAHLFSQIRQTPVSLDIRAAQAQFARRELTPRESEVLYWLSEGKTNPEIALILEIGRWTVKKHLENIFRKIGCETRTAAARWAMDVLMNWAM